MITPKNTNNLEEKDQNQKRPLSFLQFWMDLQNKIQIKDVLPYIHVQYVNKVSNWTSLIYMNRREPDYFAHSALLRPVLH